MSDVDDELSRRLTELGARTHGIRASAGFADRVMSVVEEAGPIPVFELLRSARQLLPLAIIAAVLGTAWAVQSEQSADQALVASDSLSQELYW